MPISKRNRRGLLVLFTIALIVSFAPRVLIAFKSPTDLSIEEIESAELRLESKHESVKIDKVNKSKFKKPTKKFDPNEYQKSDWVHLGLSEKQAEVVMKFSVRGFYSIEDLQKVYVFNDELINLIKDSILFSKKPENIYVSNETKKKPLLFLDLNLATSLELQSINGIGPFYGDKIVEYREKLGGFTSTEQLLEVWKFDADKFNRISPHVFIGNKNIQQININIADFKALVSHPYINSNVANAIIKYRDQHGDFKSVNELINIKIIDPEFLQKIKPYFQL